MKTVRYLDCGIFQVSETMTFVYLPFVSCSLFIHRLQLLAKGKGREFIACLQATELLFYRLPLPQALSRVHKLVVVVGEVHRPLCPEDPETSQLSLVCPSVNVHRVRTYLT